MLKSAPSPIVDKRKAPSTPDMLHLGKHFLRNVGTSKVTPFLAALVDPLAIKLVSPSPIFSAMSRGVILLGLLTKI